MIQAILHNPAWLYLASSTALVGLCIASGAFLPRRVAAPVALGILLLYIAAADLFLVFLGTPP